MRFNVVTVVYACDNAYVRQTLVSMVSLIRHNQNLRIYLIEDGLSHESQELMVRIIGEYGQEICFVDIKEVLPEMQLDEKDRHPKTIYAKLFLNNIIQEEKALYLDSDVLVEGELESLFLRDMDRELVAGVLMPYSRKIKARAHAPLGRPYICDGVVLFNLKLWSAMNVSDKCHEYIVQHEGCPPMLSEGTLNHVCGDMIGVLEPKNNLMPSMLAYDLKQITQLFKADFYYSDKEVFEYAKKKPVIIHFMDELYNRPWFEPCSHPLKQRYLDMENLLFGNVEKIRRPISRKTRTTVWMGKHLPFAAFSFLYHLKNRL